MTATTVRTSNEMSRARWGAGTLVLAAAVMSASLVSHPYLGRLPDAPGVAAAIEGQATRWGMVHLASSVGSALIAVAFIAVRELLRAAGEDRYSTWALPLVVLGSGLYGVLPGLEFAALAAARTGADVAATQDALAPWFLPILVTSAFLFEAGMLGFAFAVATSGLMSGPLTRVVVTGLIVLGLSRFVPLGAVQLYVQAAAVLVALLPLAQALWKRPGR